MGYPVRRGSRITSIPNGTSGAITLPPREIGDLVIVWVSSSGTTTLTNASGWTTLFTGSNPGVAGSASGFTGAIFARVITTASSVPQGGVAVFTSSVAVQHTAVAEVVTNHKLGNAGGIKVTATSAGNLSGSGNITYSAFAANSLVATDEYLMYGVVQGRNSGSDKAPTATSASWGNRESAASGTTSPDTFVSTQSRQITGVTALTIGSHVATTATGYWASASIAIAGATAPPPSGSSESAYDFSSSVVGSAPPVGSKTGTVTSGYDFSSSVSGTTTRRASVASAFDFSSSVTGVKPGASGNASVPTQAEMPAQPFDLYPAPTMTWGAGSAPSGAGYTGVGPTHELIKLVGHAGKGVQAGSVSGFVNPAPLQDIAGAGTGTNPLVYPPFGIRISTDHKEVWFKLAQRSYSGFSNVSSRAAVRLRVNGKWTSLMPVYVGSTIGFPANPENITAGEYWLKLTFPNTEMRHLELNTHLEFGGVVVADASGTSAQAPDSPLHILALLDGSLGGSEKHQTGNFSLSGSEGSGAAATYTAVTSYVWATAQSLGYDSIVNSGSGSSGFSISGDTASFKSSAKIPKDVIEHQPDTIIVGSANNDQAAGQTSAQVSAAADIVYGNVASTAKTGALKIALGMFTAPAMGSQSAGEASVAPYNAVLKSKAQQYGFWFVNPTTGETFDPQGTLRKTTSNWVYQDLGDVSSDNTHPTQKGANNLGNKLADAIRMAHPAGVTPPTYERLYVDRGANTWTQNYRGAKGRKLIYRGADPKISTW